MRRRGSSRQPIQSQISQTDDGRQSQQARSGHDNQDLVMTMRCTPEEAAALVRPHDTIGFGLGPGNPDAFLTALGGRDDWEDLVLAGALLLGYYTVFTKPGVSYRSGFFGPAERILLAEGNQIEHVPGGFRQLRPILARFARESWPPKRIRPTPKVVSIYRFTWEQPGTS